MRWPCAGGFAPATILLLPRKRQGIIGLSVPKSVPPVFVLGAPRSGTTWLYHMILSAGDFAVYRTESNVFNLLVPQFGNLSSRKQREKLMQVWLGSKLFERSGLKQEAIREKILEDCRSGGDFLRIVMGEIAKNQGVRRWADCTPEHLLYIPEIKQEIPDAQIIHIIRDGRDVALSLAKQNWIHPFPWQRGQEVFVAGLYWEWIVSKGRIFGRRIGSDYFEVRFEDLVKNPRDTLSALGRFIDHDLDYDRIQHVAIGSVREPNSSFGSQSSSGPFVPVGRWKRGFSPENLASFEGLVGQTLQTLGYTLATPAGQIPSSLRLRRMRAMYRLYFDSKLWLKSETPLGRLLMRSDLSWL